MHPRELDVFLSFLASTLSEGFSEHARVDARDSHVVSVEVQLEPEWFTVKRDGPHVVAQHRKLVNGAALRTVTIPVERWAELLTDALARAAETDDRAAWVLSRLAAGPA